MRRVAEWIRPVLVLVLLLAGTANAQGWTAFSPEGGRCKVDMPGTPTVETVPLNSPGQTLTMTEAKVQAGGATFFMSWVDYPERIALSASSDTMLDKVRDGMAAGSTLRGEKKLTLGRAQGREFTLAQANGTTTAVRLYWARNRLYQLGVTGRGGVENQPETRHFFESFALVDHRNTNARCGFRCHPERSEGPSRLGPSLRAPAPGDSGDIEVPRAKAHDAPGAVPGARSDLSQRRHVAASAHRGGRLRLDPARALPAHRPGLRARQVRHGLLRRPQLHLRHLYRLAGAGDPQRHPGARARSPPAAVVHGRRDDAYRARRHLLGEPSASVPCRKAVGHARSPDARPRGVERRHHAQPQPVGQLRRGDEADRRALRSRA